MNLYIIVEGEQTEMHAYPKWLSYTIPEMTQVSNYIDAQNNNYYLFSGGGIPSIYNHIANAVRDINKLNDVYNYLIVCIDSEEISVNARMQKVFDSLQENNVELTDNCELRIIVQKYCIETWFLGNRRVFKRNPEGERFREYIQHYNVEQDDPELMQTYGSFVRTPHFHESYLREMLKEYNVRYSKSRPRDVLTEPYFNEMQRRINESSHLVTFQSLIELFTEIKSRM